MATIDVLDDDGNTVAIEKPNANGRAAAASSRPVAVSTEDLAAINAITTAIANGTLLTGSGTEAGAGRVTLPTDRLGAVLSITPVMDTSIYANNDVAFIPIEITGFAHHASGVVQIDSINIIDEDDQGVALTLYFNNGNNSMGLINAAFAPTDANARAIKGKFVVAAADWEDLGGVRHACFDNVGIKVKADASGSIWLTGAIRSGTPTFTASGIKIDIGVSWC